MKKFYLSTAISYVNAAPHIGHALEFIQADALARFYRLSGVDTFFLTGTDEHGVKVYEVAKEQGIPTKELVDKNAAIFQSLRDILVLSNDDFIRTTQDRHKRGAKKLWEKMAAQGDIYKDVYKGQYCVGCEVFVSDKDLNEAGECPIHKKKPKIVEEENYFFKLSKYSDQIKEAILSGELKILPEARKNEMINLIGNEGLSDVSFSRPKSVLPWGIDVPGDENQVMYVWADALSNYITALGYENEDETFKKFWPCDAHIIGKDILRFHAGVWIGMLISAGVEIPKAIYVHGFVTSEGHKMSKSLGNVVDPLEYVKKYGVDAVRYYLLREIPTTDDGDFSHTRFVEVHNSELANGLGNLINRVVMMTERYLEARVPKETDGGDVKVAIEKIVGDYKKYFESYDLKSACECVLSSVNLGNKYIDDAKPWALAKEESSKEGKNEELKVVLYNLLELLRYICVLLFPILPNTASKIAKQIGCDVKDFNLNLKWGDLKEGTPVKKEDALFPRLEEKL